jgi:MYXO-CTERM domain-containing protein
MRLANTWILALAMALPFGLAAGTANAEPRKEACGNLELLAVGECHFEVEGGCKAQCQPLNLVAACDGQCNADISVECTSSCSGACVADCTAQPATFDCRGSCVQDCNAQIATRCDSGDQDCITYCEADCESNCDAQCEAVAPQADCETQCQGCCGGSCETDANFDCSFKCSVDLQGGCEVACDTPEGALFCDGQYIAVTDVQDCVDYLATEYNYEVKVEAKASATISCAAGGAAPSTGALVLLGAAAGLTAARRRRRK